MKKQLLIIAALLLAVVQNLSAYSAYQVTVNNKCKIPIMAEVGWFNGGSGLQIVYAKDTKVIDTGVACPWQARFSLSERHAAVRINRIQIDWPTLKQCTSKEITIDMLDNGRLVVKGMTPNGKISSKDI